MIAYLLDASVVSEFYKPKSAHRTLQDYERTQGILAALADQRLRKRATLFIPSFCICEVKNTLAKWHYRFGVFGTDEEYRKAREWFIKHVHDREIFYSYDLNRYHNINVDLVLKNEHTVDTEFQATGLPSSSASQDELNHALRERNPHDYVAKHYLSAFDLLVIAMGIELAAVLIQEIHLLTGDSRLARIAGLASPSIKPLHWKSLEANKLPGTETRRPNRRTN